MRNTDPGNDRRSLELASRTRSVTESFDRAAVDYDRYARIQRRAAASLARCVTEHAPCAATHRVLEIGCGTGILTELLIRPYHAADWMITDIAPKMVAQCQFRIRDIESPACQRDPHPLEDTREGSADRAGQRDFHVMDARAITVAGQFDLICSNLAFQWFSDLLRIVRATIERLNPGGTFIFNTLGADSFSYWRALDVLAGGEPSAPVFPSFATVADELFVGCCRESEHEFEIETETETLHDQHPSFLDFLHTLKTIGAGTRMGNRQISISQLRHVLRHSRKGTGDGTLAGVSIDYQVVTVIIRRKRV